MSKKASHQISYNLLQILEQRFNQNKDRHPAIQWNTVLDRLTKMPEKLQVLDKMETTGGEPDVVSINEKKKEIIFFDCAEESPKDRRSLCYDEDALLSRKQHPPKDSAINLAKHIGISILTEEQYRHLQTLGKFDLKTSSWILTPESIRTLGGALFCDRRYNAVFTYHNGADSYYAARGFRGCLYV